METCLGYTAQPESPGDLAKGKIDLGIWHFALLWGK